MGPEILGAMIAMTHLLKSTLMLWSCVTACTTLSDEGWSGAQPYDEQDLHGDGYVVRA